MKQGLKISKPPGKDCIIEINSKRYNIEVYQPDTSKVKTLKNAQKNAKQAVVGKCKAKYYNYSSTLDNLMEEFVSNVINNKKRKNQLVSQYNTKNILWVDLSDLSLVESLIIEDSDIFDMKNVKQKLQKWTVLDGLIISIWKHDDKVGILINKNLDEIDIALLKKGIDLKNII